MEKKWKLYLQNEKQNFQNQNSLNNYVKKIKSNWIY